MQVAETTEIVIRLGCFVGVFVALAGLETAFPRRVRAVVRARRWPANIGISALNQLLTRAVVPMTAVVLAAQAEQRGWGGLNQVHWAGWLEVLLAVLLLDLAIYLQHRLYHAVPVLWRFHRMHHADTEFDVSTGIRFHPVSVLLSACIKLAAVLALGASPLAVLVFEVLLNATSLFNHSNLKIPVGVDRVLRLLVVTPDMHRVHHSSEPREQGANFGFNFPWWDRLFRTYVAQPALGHADMRVGLNGFRDVAELRLHRMLLQPFRAERV